MRQHALVLAALLPALSVLGEEAAPRKASTYTAASIVNAASYESGALAPGTLATIFGKDLAWDTRGLTAADVKNGSLPLVFPGTGVKVSVSGIQAHLLYVSPGQINFLVPSIFVPGPVTIVVTRNALAGPEIPMELAPAGPGIFQLAPGIALAAYPDGSVVNAAKPARPGDWVIVYATGLGVTAPPQEYGELARWADPLVKEADFRVWLNGEAVAPERIYYAGVTPGYAGLYQVNLHLPEWLGVDPEIRLESWGRLSVEGMRLPVRSE